MRKTLILCACIAILGALVACTKAEGAPGPQDELPRLSVRAVGKDGALHMFEIRDDQRKMTCFMGVLVGTQGGTGAPACYFDWQMQQPATSTTVTFPRGTWVWVN